MSNTKYKAPITITFTDMVARVYFPILDSAEREKRMKKIHIATSNLLRKEKER